MGDKDIGRFTKIALAVTERMERHLGALKEVSPEPFMKKKATPMPKEQRNDMV